MLRFFALAALVSASMLAATVPAASAAGKSRIVSLMPSLTEDLFAIGAGRQVVAVSQFTDYPPVAAKLPIVASFSSIDAEKIVTLHADAIVGIAAQRTLVGDLRRAGFSPLLLSDDSFEDIFANLTVLGRISGHEREAALLSTQLRARTRALVRSVAGAGRPSVLVVLGVAPIYTIGQASYIAHLLSLAGARNATSGLREAYVRYSPEAIVALQPDAIVADRQSGLGGVLGRAPWTALRAVHEKRVYILDDADILERPGPRYNEGLAWLIARLHPDAQSAH